MSGIGAITPSTALRVVRPVHGASAAGTFHSDEPASSRIGATRAFADAGANRTRFSGPYAPFIAQLIANDNGDKASPNQGAIAYLVARDRMTDLPVGFLIARAV